MANRDVVDVLGIRIPFALLFISSRALACGVVVPMPIFCENKKLLHIIKNNTGISFFISVISEGLPGFICLRKKNKREVFYYLPENLPNV
jgi:hypothetical protein